MPHVVLDALRSYEGLAALSLALEHLNTGNGTIVPKISGNDRRCPLRFYTQAFETKAQQSTGLDSMIYLTDREKWQLWPTAVLGASLSRVTIPTSMISSYYGIPQISPSSTSRDLDDKMQHKLFARTIPNDAGTSIPLLAKLASWKVSHIGVIHTDDAYGAGFAHDLRLVALTEAPNLRIATVNINIGANDVEVSDAIRQLKETEYTYFFGVLYPQEGLVDRIVTEAYRQEIAGTELHTWIFSDTLVSTITSRNIPLGSPLEKAFRGTSMLMATGGIPGMESYDKLTLAFKRMRTDESDLTFLSDHLPKNQQMTYPSYSEVVANYETFLTKPGSMAQFIYDAAIGLGMSACELMSVAEENVSFTGEELYQAFVNTSFEGISGSVVLDQGTGSRDPSSALYTLTNYVAEDDSDQGVVRFEGIITDVFQGEWESISPYTFSDGTHEAPLDLPMLVVDPNHLGTGMQVVGLVLCGIIVCASAALGYWTYSNRKVHVVRASQPIFLYFISAGTFLMGCSIIPLTIDSGDVDKEGADAACMAFPWLLATGFCVSFCALFTKTHRIKKVMNSAATFRRVKVTPLDVMKPMLTMLLLNTTVLIVWTAIDPIRRELVVVSKDIFLRDVETRTICNSDHTPIFAAVLCAINIGSLIVAVTTI